MSLANKQTFNLISSLTICQIMLIHNNVFMNKLVSMKLYFNYIYIYIYIYETINLFFLYFFPFYTKFLLWVCIWVLLPKKAKDEVLLLPTFRFCNTNTIITYIQIAGACGCVFPLWW